MIIRSATPKDSEKLLNIYAQYIATPVTFEYTLPTIQEFADRIRDISQCYPYVLCEENNQIAGYAYARRQLERAAYQWNVEASIYVDQGATSKGLGKTLYRALIELLRRQGVKTVYGGVATPNPRSESLHKSLGFRVIGTWRKAGYKNEKWHDVLWFEKEIAAYDLNPQPVVPMACMPEKEVQEVFLSFAHEEGRP